MAKDWRYLEFTTPFTTEAVSESNSEFVIKGRAINATTTRNGNTYTVEELRANGKTLEGRPILIDHINSVDKIVGRVRKAEYSEADSALMFEGVVKDKKYQGMISEGMIQNVSVGAMIEDAEEVVDESTGKTSYNLRGLEFLEVSLVAIPADPGAGFARASFERAVSEAIKAKKAESPITLPATEQPIKAEAEEKTMETKEQDNVLAASLTAIAESVKALQAEIAELKTKKETVTPVVAVEEKKDETKGIVAKAITETKEDTKYILEKNGRAFDMTGDYTQFNHARLRRDHQ